MALDTLGVPIFNAITFGAPCVQFGVSDLPPCDTRHVLSVIFQVDDSSEDCLTLNVFRPSGSVFSNETLVPVLSWIYGGGFGLCAWSLYDASSIIGQSVLRVSFDI